MEQRNVEREIQPIETKARADLKKCECGYFSNVTAKYCAYCGCEFIGDIVEKSEEQSPMFCNQCGNRLSENVDFCSNCGNKTHGENIKSSMLHIIYTMNIMSGMHFYQ